MGFCWDCLESLFRRWSLACPPVLIPVLPLIWSFVGCGGNTAATGARISKKDEPHFKGPVYTVDYKEVKGR